MSTIFSSSLFCFTLSLISFSSGRQATSWQNKNEHRNSSFVCERQIDICNPFMCRVCSFHFFSCVQMSKFLSIHSHSPSACVRTDLLSSLPPSLRRHKRSPQTMDKLYKIIKKLIILFLRGSNNVIFWFIVFQFTNNNIIFLYVEGRQTIKKTWKKLNY